MQIRITLNKTKNSRWKVLQECYSLWRIQNEWEQHPAEIIADGLSWNRKKEAIGIEGLKRAQDWVHRIEHNPLPRRAELLDRALRRWWWRLYGSGRGRFDKKRNNMISRLKNPKSLGPREEITTGVVEHGTRGKRRGTGNAIRRTAEHLFEEFANGEKKRDRERVKGEKRKEDEREGEQDE